MRAFCRWRWCALALVLALASPAARAEMITPNSIPNPPAAVGSAQGTHVLANNLVTNQYANLGLNFDETAISKVNGASAWVPLGPAVNFPGVVNDIYSLSGELVSPGSGNPRTVSSLTVGVAGGPVSVSVSGLQQLPLNIAPVITSIGNVQDWTFTGSGISGFSVDFAPPNIGAWGVSAVSFTPSTATAPEPSSLVLAALGALGMASRLGWRRFRAVA